MNGFLMLDAEICDIYEVNDVYGEILGTLVLLKTNERIEDYLLYEVYGQCEDRLKEIFLSDCMFEVIGEKMIDELNEKYRLGCLGIKSNHLGIDYKRWGRCKQ